MIPGDQEKGKCISEWREDRRMAPPPTLCVLVMWKGLPRRDPISEKANSRLPHSVFS